MDARKAKKYLKNDNEVTSPLTCHHPFDQGVAVGFLEAVEKTKIVIKKLEDLVGKKDCYKENLPCNICEARELLKFYKRNVLGE